MGYRLGVDLGTTFTAAALDDGSGPAMLGLGNRSLQVPSVVFLQADGTFVYGEAAERAAATAPERSVREFKRRIGDTVPILVAGQPFSPVELTSKLLGWVVGRASQRQGEGPEQVVLTYPANWGGYKRELLRQVVSLADLSDAVTCTEPEAAATQYASRARLSVGDKLAVYDLGGGTFDVCVLEQQAGGGFKILGSPDGVEHLGGIDFDEAVFAHVWAMLGDRVASLDPEDPAVVVGVSRLRRDCVEAKEALSESVEAVIPVTLPGVATVLHLGSSELEALIGVPLRDTVDATHRALRSAGVAAGELSAVVLVGGSSRIPLVSQLLRSELGVPTAMDTHPKHDIALGAVRYRPLSVGASAPAAARTVRQWPTRGEGEAAAPPAVPPRASTPPAPRAEQAAPTASTPPAQHAGQAAPPADQAPPASTPPAPPAARTVSRWPTRDGATAASTPAPSPPAARTPATATPPPVAPAPAARATGPTDPAGVEPPAWGPTKPAAAPPPWTPPPAAGTAAGARSGLASRRTLWLGAAAAGALVIAGVAGYALLRDKPGEADPGGSPSVTESPSPTDTPSASPLTPLPAGPPLPDSQLLYVRGPQGDRVIVTGDAATGAVVATVTSPGISADFPFLSPDRATLVYVAEDTLRVVGVNGQGDQPLLRDPAACPKPKRGAWSTVDEGRFLVLVCNGEDDSAVGGDMVVLDRQTMTTTVLVPETRIGFPTVSPDGRSIAFCRGSAAEACQSLEVIGLDGGAPRQLTTGEFIDGAPAWSPDGSRIAFRRAPNEAESTSDIWTITPVGADPRRITSGSADEYAPTWSPDGTQIAFASRDPNLGLRPRIWVAPADGSAAPERMFADETEISELPLWSRR